jgi:N6-L-threonylcarbamoyladenine synthase
MKRVLAIESSCDETAASVVEMKGGNIQVVSSVVASQIDIHKLTQGVVPEVAARAHVEAIDFVIKEAIKDVAIDDIDAIAATTQPGLRPALVVGETAGRALAAAWNKPFVPAHHIAGHIGAAWLDEDEKKQHKFPAIVLVVSGGHTQLYRMDEDLKLTLLGNTRDDAAGEAFDKIARLLGLPYPGGPELSKLAIKGNDRAYDFPRPMLNSEDLDFSFSGLKTAVLYAIRDKNLSETEKADVAASAQAAIVEILVKKTLSAVTKEEAKEVIVAGGVAANTLLREKMKENLKGLPFVIPPIKYCTDNAAMIGAATLLGIAIP